MTQNGRLKELKFIELSICRPHLGERNLKGNFLCRAWFPMSPMSPGGCIAADGSLPFWVVWTYGCISAAASV